MNKRNFINPSFISSLKALLRLKEIISNTTPINESASDPKIYLGTEEVFQKITEYRSSVNDLASSIADPNEAALEIMKYFQQTLIIVLFDTVTNSVLMIQDFGKHIFCPEDFLFKTDFIPIHIGEITDIESLELQIQNTVNLLSEEIGAMQNASQNPIFLIEHTNSNDYRGWNLTTNCEVNVCEYKSYLSHNLDVFPPSSELISALGLSLFPSTWETKSRHDPWGRRPQLVPKFGISDFYPEYARAIELINISRTSYLEGLDFEFEILETIVKSLEDSPNVIVCNMLAEVLKVTVEGISELLGNVQP